MEHELGSRTRLVQAQIGELKAVHVQQLADMKSSMTQTIADYEQSTIEAQRSAREELKAALSEHESQLRQLRKQLAEPSDAPLSLYVHVPFCRHACWYCGCNRVTTQLGSTVVAPYLATLAQELELVSAALPARRRLAQLQGLIAAEEFRVHLDRGL